MTSYAERARRVAWNSAAVAAVWLTSLAVVALWVLGAGVQSLLRLDAETVTTLGRLTGLVSANLLLYQVVLMARVPLFEKGFGHDALTRAHRRLGQWSLALLAAHIVLLVAGSAMTADVPPLLQLWQFVVDYPGMLLAVAATALLVLVAATSIRRARRRLRYESWHLLHLYAYLGVGLAIPHMLWTGADFTEHPWAAALWWMLWAAAAGCVLVYRVALPLLRSLRHPLRVTSVEPDGRRGVVVRMRGRGLRSARAGQFSVWRFLGGPGWSRGHPLSFAAAPRDDELVIAARIVGDGTRRLTGLAPGTRVLVEGPYGRMTGSARTRPKLLMLAAGAGLAPLVALLEAERYRPGEAVLVTRDHDDRDRMRTGAIERLVRERGVRHVALDGPRGAAWLPASCAAWSGPDLLRRLAPDAALHDVFVCGPRGWTDDVRRDLRAAGFARDAIHTESFSL